MSKQNLPKHWIIVKSKKHPDRVYYFNKKTNKSSWDEPTDDASEKIKTKSKQRSSKRLQSDEERNLKCSKPSTPPDCNSSQNGVSQRKKLVGRRSLHQPMEKPTNEDTPQMRALREKIQKKKESVASRKSSASEASVSKTSTVSSNALSKEKLSVSLPKIDINDETSASSFTPQMKVLFEKIQKRKSKGGDEIKLKSPKRCTANSQSSTAESVMGTRDTLNTPSTAGNSVQTRAKKKSSDTSRDHSISKKRCRSSMKKNLAAERMDKFKQRLSLEKEKLEKSINSQEESENVADQSTTRNNTSVPHIYKNAQVRLVRLKDKLLKDKLSPSKRLKHDHLEECKESTPGSATTVIDLVNESVESSFYEEMDWEPMEDERITTEIQTVRNELYADSNAYINSNVPRNDLGQYLSPAQRESRQLYFVIDTNVFLSDIGAVDQVKETNLKTYDRSIIVIPWTVIRELDYIKDNKHKKRSAALCTKARHAIQYLNKLFASKHPRVIGQTPEDAAKNKERFAIDCPDDEILQTCLQFRDLGKSVVLLTYDKNLCNKAMIHDIVTLGRSDPIEKIDYLNASKDSRGLMPAANSQSNDEETESMTIIEEELRVANEIFDEVSIVIKDFLSVIISKEMHALYGESWEKYVIIRPPWTTVSALRCAVKHWIAAISESFCRKAEETLKSLLRSFESSSGLKRLKDVGHLLEKCNDLFQMVNTEKHLDLMLRASQKIKELKATFVQFESQLNEKKIRDMIGIETNILEEHRRAEKAFKYFESAYAYARDMGGLAAEAVGMPCSIPHEIPNPVPPLEFIKQIQPELAANVNRLLHTLSAVLEQTNNCAINPRTLINLCETLDNFLPESMAPVRDLSPLDMYCCIKQKEQVLKTGLRQLQELSTHFCRLASYRCT